jgi:hypothetical protein
MTADPIHPDQLHGQARFRADLVAYLDSLSVGELAELLGELPRSSRWGWGAHVRAERAATRRLPAVAARRPSRPRHADARASRLAGWLADRQGPGELPADRERERQN